MALIIIQIAICSFSIIWSIPAFYKLFQPLEETLLNGPWLTQNGFAGNINDSSTHLGAFLANITDAEYYPDPIITAQMNTGTTSTSNLSWSDKCLGLWFNG